MVADSSFGRASLVPSKTATSNGATITYSSPHTNWNLTDINNWTVGFDRQWKLLEDVHNTVTKSTYPPYNIIKVDDAEYIVEVALAGFTKDEIEIKQHNGILTVSGKKSVVEYATYVHKGIAARDFTHQFALAEYVNVVKAESLDGILKITLKQDLPEEKKPRIIDIL